MSVAYQDDLHIREIAYNNNIVIISDRGLDIYRPPDSSGTRTCRAGQVMYFETAAPTTSHNVHVPVTSPVPLKPNQARGGTTLSKFVNNLPKMNGVLKSFFPGRGYGFVSISNGDVVVDVYFRDAVLPRGSTLTTPAHVWRWTLTPRAGRRLRILQFVASGPPSGSGAGGRASS